MTAPIRSTLLAPSGSRSDTGHQHFFHGVWNLQAGGFFLPLSCHCPWCSVLSEARFLQGFHQLFEKEGDAFRLLNDEPGELLLYWG